MGIVRYETRTCRCCHNGKLVSVFPYDGCYCATCFPLVEQKRLKQGKKSLVPANTAPVKHSNSPLQFQVSQVHHFQRTTREVFLTRHYLHQQVRSNNIRARTDYGWKSKITTDEWIAVLEQHAYACAICGTTSVALTIDHIVPLCRGGTHTVNNIQPACLPCNCRKGAR